jgi:hypothetical protein
MVRKLMAVMVLGAVPALSFGVAQFATSGEAGAAGTGGSTTCHGVPGAWVNFAPGITAQGRAKKGNRSGWPESGGQLSCTGKHAGSGGFLGASQTVSNTLTCSDDPNPPVDCPAGDYVYLSALEISAQFGTVTGTASWFIGSKTYDSTTTSSAAATTGSGPGECPSGEDGYVLFGHLTKPTTAKSTTMTICFLGDFGSGTTNNFADDLASELAGNTSIDIGEGDLDATASSILFG